LRAYVTGGLAFSQVKATASCTAISPSWCFDEQYEVAEKVMTGWTAGAGAEYDFAANWFTRGEYRYTDLGEFQHNFFEGAAADTISAALSVKSHRFDLGLGYKF
jgi:outer membrane immunogenic protein